MPLSSTTSTSEYAGPAEKGRKPAKGEIELEALAERIYQLLKEEARLERERLGRRRAW